MSMSLNQYCRQVSFQFLLRDEFDDIRIASDLFSFRTYHEIQIIVSEGEIHLDMPSESSRYTVYYKKCAYPMIGNQTPRRVIHPWEITWYDLEHTL
jgi:hypothetical protein